MKTKTSGQHGQHCAKTAASQAPPGNVAEEEVNYIFSAGVSATNTNLGGAGA